MSFLTSTASSLAVAFLSFNVGILGELPVSSSEAPSKNILFISSYSQSWSSVPDQFQGIRHTLLKNYRMDCEYMDTKNNPYPGTKSYTVNGITYSNYKDYYYHLFKDRYGTSLPNYDIFVVGDDPALDFAVDFYDDLFKGKPIIFEGINSIERATRATQNANFGGLIQASPHAKTLKMATTLLPNATTCNLLYDDTETGAGEYQQFMDDTRGFSFLTYRSFNTSDMSLSEVQAAVSSFSKKSINIYLTFGEDKNGNTYDDDAQLSALRGSINGPVFRSWKSGIGDCFVGGYVYSHYYAGEITGNLLNSVLSGTPISSVKILLSSDGYYEADYPMMARYSLDISKLPAQTYLDDAPFYITYRDTINLAAIIASITLIISSVFFYLAVSNSIKNKKLNKAYATLKQADTELKVFASTDYLTGLKNHGQFNQDLDEWLEKKEPFFLTIFDISNFKSINDLFGHIIGDEVLENVAEILNSSLNKNQRAYRYGGDEFALLLPGKDRSEIEPFLQGLLTTTVAPKSLQHSEVRVSFSVGVASYPKDGTRAEELFGNADSAMYYVKATIKTGWAYFDENEMQGIKKNSHIEDALRQAIDKSDVYMAFQPIYSIKNKRYESSEALMRIRNCPYGPAEFIPVAEQSGLIVQLGRLAIKQGIEFLAALKAKGITDQSVAVNFSGAQVADVTFFEYTGELLEKNHIDPHNLILEFTESIFFKNAFYMSSFLKRITDKGVVIALDDFGSGYSSFSSLSSYPFATVKLDKSIIDTMFRTKAVENLIQFCHSSGYSVVAEGVENKDQVAFLEKLHCEMVQGYYFTKPMIFDQALAFFVKEAESEEQAKS